MTTFSAYEKMPDNLKKLGANYGDFAKQKSLKWVVTEKIHGANFSFVYEQGQLKYAKRKAYLSWQDDFFGFQLVVNQIEQRIIQLFEDLSNVIKANKYIVYGELFGGAYPHPDVVAIPYLQAIQTGVYYSPNIHFCAFDIAIVPNHSSSKYYLEYETACSYFDQHQVFHARPLFIGKLNEALRFNTRINSTIPKLLHLPELSDNLIEGVVIKPFSQKATTVTRPIFKLKNKEFEEQKKFHQAKKWAYIPDVSSKSEDLSFLVEELNHYVTENRLQSAISKIGALDFANKQRLTNITSEFLRDTLHDFNENNDQLLNELSDEEIIWIKERVHTTIKQLILVKKTI